MQSRDDLRDSVRDFGRRIRAPLNKRSALNNLEKFHSQPRNLDEIIDVAMKFPSKGLFRVASIQKRSEIISLARAVAELKPRNILEIGTARAGTLFIWSQLASHKVVSCDLEDPGTRRSLYESFPPSCSKCMVTTLTGDSHHSVFCKKVEQQFGDEKVDFLFIDGDHTEKGVEADYNDYCQLVRPGGLIAFHDIVEKQILPTNQVHHFWKRLILHVDYEEIVDDPDQSGFGIGLVRVS